MSLPQFYIGQIVEHKKFSYRGVIVGIDEEFSSSEEWYQVMAISQPPKDKPWYHVLVDRALHNTYVAERNLITCTDTQQIEHPLLGEFFNRYDGQRYFVHEASHH